MNPATVKLRDLLGYVTVQSRSSLLPDGNRLYEHRAGRSGPDGFTWGPWEEAFRTVTN